MQFSKHFSVKIKSFWTECTFINAKELGFWNRRNVTHICKSMRRILAYLSMILEWIHWAMFMAIHLTIYEYCSINYVPKICTRIFTYPIQLQCEILFSEIWIDHLWGLVVRVPGFDSWSYQIGSGKESTQPREDKWGATWMKKLQLRSRNPRLRDLGDLLCWPRNIL
jgi:hypothetical protein